MTLNAAILSELSKSDRRVAEQAIQAREARQRETQDTLQRNLTKAREGLRRGRQRLLGANGLDELRRGLRAETRRSRESLQPPEGLGADADKETNARKRRGNALLKRLGATPEQMADLGRAAEAQTRKLLEATDGEVTDGYYMPANLQRWLDLSPLHTAARPWGAEPDTGEPDPNAFTLFRPPFFGFNMQFTTGLSGFRADREVTLLPQSGLIGHIVTMDDDDASDWDTAYARADTVIAFGYEPPTAGRIQVLVDAQNIRGLHDLRFADEWGWSSGWCHQRNYFILDVMHPDVPEPSLALMSDFERDFSDDRSYHEEDLEFGQHYFATLTSAGSVPAGQSVVVAVGTRTLDVAAADDIEVHSRTEFLWLIDSIEVRMVPA